MLSTSITDEVVTLRPFCMEDEMSRRVAEKIKAHYEGILLNRMVVGKAVYDAMMYSLIPSDFGLNAKL